jgi:DNA (cytosine-5)-methyltransferase 1
MNCVSLYTGCGGLDLGFGDAGFRTVWAHDIDPFALETYRNELIRRGHSLPEIFCGDVSKAVLPAKGSVDVVIGGPPCQGFSVAGKMDPNDPRSKQVWEFFRVVEELDPSAFVMENVKALATNSRWAGTIMALEAKGEKLGYKCRVMVLNAADYGVPQMRERMFLVGMKKCIMPKPIRLMERVTVRKALSALPTFGQPGNDSICKAKVTAAKVPVLRKSPYAGMLFNGQGRPVDLDAPALTLPASMGGNRTPIIDQLSLEKGTKPWVASYHAHLLAEGVPAAKVPSRLRRLTVEEAACLQGFPTGMVFSGSQCTKFRQIGNSVPPALGAAVAKELKKVLEGDSNSEEWRGNQKCWVAEDAAQYEVA